MNTNLVLGYWDCRGLGETVRLLLEYLDLSYTEEKYATESDEKRWVEVVKPKMACLFPNLPYLIDNGEVITETDAILYYLAKKKDREDLFGTDFKERLLILQVRGVLKDVAGRLTDLVYNSNYNEALKEECLKENGFIEKKLVFLNKFLEGKNFLLGANVKFVDFYFYEIVQLLKKLSPKMVEKFERLAVYSENFRQLNGIQNYLKSPRFDATKQFTNALHSSSKI